MIEKNENESRLEYLTRVLERFMFSTPAGEQTIEYDETTCDGICLAEDIRIEIDQIEI